MKNNELIESLQNEEKEYKGRVNKLDAFLHSGKAEKLDDYDLGLLQNQREIMITLTVILGLRIKSLKCENQL